VTLAELTARISVVGENAARQAFQRLGTSARSMGEAIRSAADATRLLEIAGNILARTSGIAVALSFDAQVRGLAAYSRNAEELTGQLARLQEIAKLPGVGLAEVRQGVLQLEAAGMAALTAERSIQAFGNAIALAGRGKEDLAGAVLQLSQMVANGKLAGDELNIISERVPQIRRVMKEAFGTSSTEEISKMGMTMEQIIDKMITGLEQLPKASGGAITTLDNLSDAFDQAILPIGRGIIDIFQSFAPAGEQLFGFIGRIGQQIGQMFSAIGQSGVVLEVLQSLFNLLGGGQGGFSEQFASVSANILAFFDQLPNIIRNAMQLATQYVLTPLAHIAATVGNMLEILPVVGGTFKNFARDARGFADSLSARQFGPLQSVDIEGRAQQFRARIMANIRPQGLPEGLIFGGGQKSTPGMMSPAEGLLDRIEKNTRQTAEAISEKRAGGGALFQLGVTAREQRVGVAGALSSMGSSSVMGGTQIERQIRRVVMDEIRRTGGYGIPRG